jgi:ABC-2 type transport system ATP-binding protein
MIEIQDLTVNFRSVCALKSIWLCIGSGEIIALVGANGSGKTTLVKTIAGFQHPSNGKVMVDGIDSWREREKLWPAIDFLEAQQHLPESLNALEAIRLFCPELNKSEVREKAQRVFSGKALDLSENHYLRPVSQLSHGMRQKVLIATLRDVPYWFLDEPTQGFDPNISESFRSFIVGQNRTVFWVTHNMGDAERAQRIIVLHLGCIVASGPPAILKRWISADSLEEVYSNAVSESCSFVCRNIDILCDPAIPPGGFIWAECPNHEILVENELYSNLNGKGIAPSLADNGKLVLPPYLGKDRFKSSTRLVCHLQTYE